MVTIGNTILPGVQTTVESSRAVGVNVGSPGGAGLVGEGDLDDGVANPNEVKRITSASAAQNEFGRDSELANNISDALAEGAFPVYAVASAGSSLVDYENAIDALIAENAEDLDFIGVLSVDEDVVIYLHSKVKQMEGNGNFAVVLAGADVDEEDIAGYENPLDSSRAQLVYPSTTDDDDSLIGAYVGLRSRLGMNASPMRKRLTTKRNLSISLGQSDMELLASERVNPIKNERAGALIIDDMTTVDDNNVAESEFRQGISRIVTDYVTLLVNANSDAFIGELHTLSARNSLQEIIKSELKNLLDLNAVTGYTVNVEKINAMEARVDVGIETTKPLRNIRATVTAGQIN